MTDPRFDPNPAIPYQFKVRLDAIEIAGFTRVEGLAVRYDVMKVKEGGENSFVHNLPGRLEYDNVQLTRPVDDTSGIIAAFFTSALSALSSITPPIARTGSIESLNSDGDTVAIWLLQDVTPVSYKGPHFDIMVSTKVAFETIELAHTGFFNFNALSL